MVISDSATEHKTGNWLLSLVFDGPTRFGSKVVMLHLTWSDGVEPNTPLLPFGCIYYLDSIWGIEHKNGDWPFIWRFRFTPLFNLFWVSSCVDKTGLSELLIPVQSETTTLTSVSRQIYINGQQEWLQSCMSFFSNSKTARHQSSVKM